VVVPDTEAARALMAINVLPEQIAELSDMPLITIQSAIRDGQMRPGIRDLAGWVVHLLRNVRDHGWHIQPLAPRPDSPEALRAAFARYAVEQEAVYGHEGISQEVLASHDGDTDAMPGGAENGTAAETGACNLKHLPTVAPASLDLDRLWNIVLATVRIQISRQEYHSSLRGIVLQSIEDGIATIAVPGVGFKECLENRYLGLLREVLESLLGFPIQVRVVLQGARSESACLHRPQSIIRAAERNEEPTEHSGKSVAEQESRPAWISADYWERLPKMLRAALIGSTLDNGVVRGKTDYITQLLQTRYAADVAALQSQYV
jgi:hypothetical protein